MRSSVMFISKIRSTPPSLPAATTFVIAALSEVKALPVVVLDI